MKTLIKKTLREGYRFKRRVRKALRRMAERLAEPDFPVADAQFPPPLKCMIAHNQYGMYCVPYSSRHRTAAQRVLAGGVYEPETIAFIRANCGDGDIVHAGMYFGDFLPGVAGGCAPEARVWAFEPNPENFRCAAMTARLNGLGNVALTNAGLGARHETLVVQTSDKKGRALGGRSEIKRAETDAHTPGTEPVEIVGIDEIVPADRRVTIVQLDVEGHEKEALIGALDTIKRCWPILIVESIENSTLVSGQWFADTILALGYEAAGTLHENSVFKHTAGDS